MKIKCIWYGVMFIFILIKSMFEKLDMIYFFFNNIVKYLYRKVSCRYLLFFKLTFGFKN